MLWLLLLVLLSRGVRGAARAESRCSYQDLLDHLNLSRSNELFSLTRPVRDHRQPTVVSVELLLYAILDVIEIAQTFVPYVWIVTRWQNQFIRWNPDDFCGIDTVSLPTGVLWKPDLTIEEMTEKDKAPPSPHLSVQSDGLVRVQNDQVLVSTCRMRTHKFPFDVQICNLSFKSVIHSVKEIQLVDSSSSSRTSDMAMRTQYEWLFVSMTVTNKTVDTFDIKQDMLIYTITVKRRPLLYIVNFLLPVLFLLSLDIASFFISEREGEKLSFKVTVLLAVTVMQLLLNEILPASSDQIPLIVVYCVGIFGLMMLSLLETILVMYLMEKDNVSHAEEDVKKTAVSVCEASPDGSPEDPPEVNSSPAMEEPRDELSQELSAVLETLHLNLNSIKKEEEKAGRWARATRTINAVFFLFYLVAVVVFLLWIFLTWTAKE